MIIDDTTARFEALLAFHRRAERHLATLAALPVELVRHGPTPAATLSAETLLACFDRECARRHAEEERELLPLLERCIEDDATRGHFRGLRRELAEQHRAIEAAWRNVRRPLQAVAEGLQRRLDMDDIARLRMLFAAHIQAEEDALHRVTARLAALARH